MSKANKNLPSITTMDETYCSERSGALGTTVVNDETIPKKVEEMLGFSRMSGKEINEEDLQAVARNTEVLLKDYYANDDVRRMYTRYQNMWRTFVAKEKIENEYDDIRLVQFFKQIKNRYSPNTIWVIFSCINADFIERFGINLNTLPRLKKFLKHVASKYVAKKSATFSPEEIEKILLYLQENVTPKNTLHGVAISLLYFGLLRGNEVRAIVVSDVTIVKQESNPRVEVAFAHDRKKRNNGFKFYVAGLYLPIFERYLKELCQKTVKAGKVQFLKNWNKKGNRRIQNTGKSIVNDLHVVACGILNKNPDPYTTHTWRRSAATNLADAGVSFINLKRHGQWLSDAVVEGYIANSKPLRDERLHCLMPAPEKKKEKVVKEKENKIDDNQIVEIDEEGKVSNDSPKIESTDLTLIGLSQYYDPDFDLNQVDSPGDGVPVLSIQPEPNRAAAASMDEATGLYTASLVPKPSNNVAFIMDALTKTPATFMNCTFNFGK